MVGVPEGQTLTLIIDNINNFTKLYREGFKPVFKTENEGWV